MAHRMVSFAAFYNMGLSSTIYAREFELRDEGPLSMTRGVWPENADRGLSNTFVGYLDIQSSKYVAYAPVRIFDDAV
jgi:hypothetical protein